MLTLLCVLAGVDTLRRVPQDYPTIQAAVESAAPGDTVLLAAGDYAGPLRLDKPLILRGDAGARLRGGDPILTVLAGASGTTLEGLTFEGGGKAVVLDRARRVELLDCRFLRNGGDQLSFESAGGSARNCHFEGAGDDNVDIDGASEARIEGCVLLDAKDDNLEMRFQPYVGERTLEVVIRDNLISGAKGGDGIQLIDYPGMSNRVVRIERNLIRGAAWVGIGSMENGRTKEGDVPDAPRGSPQVEKIYVVHNTLAGNRWGVSGGRNMLLLNNLIVGCGGAALRRVGGRSLVAGTGFWGNAADLDEVARSSGERRGDPRLDAEGRPAADSPAVDAGLASADWNGETVSAGPFRGSAPDLGAFESGAEALPRVRVTSSESPAREPSVPAAFTLSRSGPLSGPLRVSLAVGGSATSGVDYAALPATITFPEGVAVLTLALTPRDDADAEELEDVTLALRPGPGYGIGRPNRATLFLADDDSSLPELSVAAEAPTASEAGGKPGVFLVTRSGDTSKALTARFALSGEAVNGRDYRAETTLRIPAGASSARLEIVPIDDAEPDEEEVTLRLLADPAYRVGHPSAATLTIEDDDRK